MRFTLRWRLLLLTVLTPAVLALGTFAYLSRTVREQVRHDIDDSLLRAALMFEKRISQGSDALAVTGRVIARDPRFFAAVALPGGAADAGSRATMGGVAEDFQALTHADVFEVWDRRGRVMSSVGAASTTPGGRAWLADSAAHGREATGLLVEQGAHYQVALTPVRVDGMLAGALLLGVQIGPALAGELHALTRSEVTFVSNGTCTGSSLPDGPDRRALLQALAAGSGRRSSAPIEVHGSAAWVMLARALPGSAPGAGQWFVIERSLSAETAFLRHAQKALLGFALVAVLAAALLGAFTAERITHPLLQLVRGAEAMERGDYDVPIEAAGNDEIGYLGTRFRDMRSRERDYVASLEEVARLKSEFISVASHELRTPITVIKGYHDLFYQGALGPITPHQEQALSAIDSSLEGLIRLTEDATRIAQIEGERLILYRDEHDLAAVVQEAVALATHDAPGRKLLIEQHIEDGIGTANVDGQRLMHAVANLVRNAIRFTPDGGSIKVRARTERGGFVIEVEDDGIGIEPEQQRQLFSRAFVMRDIMHHHSSKTLEFRSTGLGLGLAIARGIVEAHDGTISVESEPAKGSVFTIRLPRLTLVRTPERAAA